MTAPSPTRRMPVAAHRALWVLQILLGLFFVLLDQPGPSPRIALAAPTGKAAARLQEAVAERMSPAHRERVAEASTLHRLLGWRPGGGSRRAGGWWPARPAP